MSATATAHEVIAHGTGAEELELDCIVCHGPVGCTEKVAYWPPTPDRPGIIAHVRCLNDAGSL